MKGFISGLILGLFIGGASFAWASGQFVWVFPNGKPAGSPADPIYIQNI